MHALHRAQERVAQVTVEDLVRLTARIRYDEGGSAWMLKPAKRGCEEWVLKDGDLYWLVIYAPKDRRIVTVFDPPCEKQIISAQKRLRVIK